MKKIILIILYILVMLTLALLGTLIIGLYNDLQGQQEPQETYCISNNIAYPCNDKSDVSKHIVF